MKAKQTITKFLKVFLVTGLYLSFFTVQLLFNFDLANTQKASSGVFAIHSQGHGNLSHTVYKNPSVTAKANIRLNKRFEPNSIPDCIAPIIEICLFYHMPEKLGHYYEQSVLSTIKLSAFLRGPPANA